MGSDKKMKRKDFSPLVKRYLQYMSKGRSIIFLSTFCSVIYAVFSISVPYLAGKTVDNLKAGNDLYVCLGLMILAIGLSSLSQFLLFRLNNTLAFNTSETLRNEAYSKIARLPVSYLDKTTPGRLQNMIISEIETISDGTVLFLNQFASGLVSICLTLGIMMFISWKISLIVLVFTPLTFVIANFISGRTFSSFKKQAETRNKQTAFINEMTDNFRESKIFDMTSANIGEFDELNETFKRQAIKATFYSSITNPSTRFVNALIYAGVTLAGSLAAIPGSITVGSLTSLWMYANQFMKPFNDLSSVYTELTDSFACMERVFKFLDEDELDEDLAMLENEGLGDKKGRYSIEFKKVTFSYVPGRPVLEDVSFKVDAGTSVALVGPTGCGKTTMISLLMRYYEPDSGEILINGRNIKEIPRTTLRDYIGFVPQDTWFRNDEILANLTFGKPDASLETVTEAAAKTGANSFIKRLPGKYHERLDKDSEDISEGQRQLLSITRAMIKDPSIMILDEATSSVDVLTEYKIQKAVRELLAGRTGIIIAHRLSTIIDCDKIVVFEKGRLTEEGTHAGLMRNGGFYSRLYRSYTGGEDE